MRPGRSRLRLPRRHQHRDRRHLQQQFAEERPAAGAGRCGDAAPGCIATPGRRGDASMSPRARSPCPTGAQRAAFRSRRSRGTACLNGVDELGYLLAPRSEIERLRAAAHEGAIAVLPGDGIGPEVIAEALALPARDRSAFGHEFEMHRAALRRGGDRCARRSAARCTPLPPAMTPDAVLLGAVGGPQLVGAGRDGAPGSRACCACAGARGASPTCGR